MALQFYYSIWLINVLLVDSVYIPKLNYAVINFASLAVALTSGEFFHVRLLTACSNNIYRNRRAWSSQYNFLAGRYL